LKGDYGKKTATTTTYFQINWKLSSLPKISLDLNPTTVFYKMTTNPSYNDTAHY
jgi:hypothetical protein